MWRVCQASAGMRSVCRMDIGAMDFRSAGSRHSMCSEGIISPGGVGYDINCGMRLIRTDLTLADVQPRLEQLMTELFRKVPAGVGASGFVRLSTGGISPGDDRWSQVVCGAGIWVASGSRPHGRRRLYRGGRSLDRDRPRDDARHESAGNFRVRQSLP